MPANTLSLGCETDVGGLVGGLEVAHNGRSSGSARTEVIASTVPNSTQEPSAKPHHHGSSGNTAKPTPYAFRAVGYGTRVRDGDLPVSSGTTSYQAIACTNLIGTVKENQVATVELPGLGRLDGVLANTGTTGAGDNVSTYATHEIASLSLELPTCSGSTSRRSRPSLGPRTTPPATTPTPTSRWPGSCSLGHATLDIAGSGLQD